MASIDNKVVSITFDNRAFEKNVSQTLRTLATLKASLDFNGASSGLQDISSAASKFSLAGIGDAVDGIASKFSAMGAIAFSVINNITSRAVDAGLQLAKQFTLAPVTEGFAEFELKMGSIQTIMAGSGESLETVNAKLEELNRYSDQTIYSFADMTQNIGKFTNAGLDLDTSVASIQGIANVAAISGANAEEASRAMYNFAQSLSAGSVKLIDWKSIENANMATAEFKQQLIDSAVAAGSLNMSADGLYTTLEGTPVTATKGFNESLQDQWLTTEALNATLGRYSDTSTDIGKRATAAASDIKTFSQMMDTLKESAASGWGQSFEVVIGDFEEGKALFTEIGESLSDVIGNSANARNTVLQDWKDLGGRTLLIDSIREGIQNITALLQPLTRAFRGVFPRKTGEDLMRMTESFSRFVKMLQPSVTTVNSLTIIFRGFFSAIKIGMEILKGVASVFSTLFKTLFSLVSGGGGPVLGFFLRLASKITELRKSLVDEGGIAKYFEKINEAIKSFSFAPLLAVLGQVGDRFRDLSERAQGAAAILMDAASKGFSAIAVALSGLSTAFDSVKSALAWFFSSDVEDSGLASSETGESVSRFSMILSGLGGIAMGVVNAFKALFSGLGKAGSFVGKIGSSIKDALSGVWDAIAGAVSGANAPSMDSIFKVLAGGAVAAIAGALVSFAKNGFKIDFGQFGLLEELSESLGAVTGVLKAMQKDILAGALLKIAVAIGVLTLSLIALSFVDGKNLAKSMTAVSVGLGALVAAMAGLDKVASGEGKAAKIALLAVAMTAIAGAMLLLAMAATLMATTDPVALSIGLLGMLASLEMIANVMERLTKNTDGMVKAAFSVGVLSVSLLLLAAAVRTWMALDMVDMAVAIFAISAALTVITETMGKMPADGMVKAAFSIGLLSAALVILAFAIKQMSNIGLVDTATGLVTMGIALALLSAFIQTVAGPNVLKAGAAMLLMSVGVGRLASGIKDLGSIDLGTLAKGMVSLAVVLKILAKALNTAKQSIGGAAAMMIIAASITMLAYAIEYFGRLPIPVLIQGIVAFGLALGALALASSIITPIVPVMATLGAALVLIGAAVFLAGAGLMFFARGVSLLAKVGPEGVVVFLESLDDLLIALPKIAAAMGVAAFTFVTAFLSGFDELIPLVVSLLGKLLDAITELRPKIQTVVLDTIVMLLESVRTLYPEFVKTGWGILMAFLQGIEDNIGELASTAIGIVTNFINAMSEGIPDYVRAMVNLFTTVMETMAFELGLLMTTLGPSLGIAFIDGVLTGIKDTVQKIKDFFGEWAGQILDFVKGLFGIKSPSTVFAEIGTFLIDGLLKGIVDTIVQVTTFFLNLPGDILGWIGNLALTLHSTGVDLLTGLWNGIDSIVGTVSGFFTGLIGSVKNWIGSTLTSLVSKGADLLEGLWTGIQDTWEKVSRFFGNLGSTFKGFFRTALTWLVNVGKDIIEGLWNGIKNKFVNWMKDKLDWLWGLIPGWIKSALGISSPSKVMMEIGKWIPIGLGVGILNEQNYLKKASSSMSNAITSGFHVDEKELTNPIREAVSSMVQTMDGLEDLDGPVITPVLDLTQVTRDARQLGAILNTSGGLQSALAISSSDALRRADALSTQTGPTEFKYEQIINAPTPLSTADIYRQTRSLIAITKEEVEIP